MNISDDGIAIFDGFFPPELCNAYIKHYEDREKAGFVSDRWTQNGIKSNLIEDNLTAYENGSFLTDMNMKEDAVAFLEIFWGKCYPLYVKKFAVIKDFETHKIYTIHLQKTLPAQGYHVWHCESGDRSASSRILAFILYLNDVSEGGETEFLYAKKRVQPKQGRLLLFPAGFTHAHRGNPPLSGTKYIFTGWLEF